MELFKSLCEKCLGVKRLFWSATTQKPKERKPPIESQAVAASPAATEMDAPPAEVVQVEASPPGKLLPDNQLGLTPSPPKDSEAMATPYYPPPEGEDGGEKSPPEPVDPPNPEHTEAVEDVEDTQKVEETEEPPIPPVMISKQAADARLRRACAPNSKGEYKVPQQVVDEYADAKHGRANLMKLFERCAHDTDWVGEKIIWFGPQQFFFWWTSWTQVFKKHNLAVEMDEPLKHLMS